MSFASVACPETDKPCSAISCVNAGIPLSTCIHRGVEQFVGRSHGDPRTEIIWKSLPYYPHGFIVPALNTQNTPTAILNWLDENCEFGDWVRYFGTFRFKSKQTSDSFRLWLLEQARPDLKKVLAA
jgi:hypothetical protein